MSNYKIEVYQSGPDYFVDVVWKNSYNAPCRRNMGFFKTREKADEYAKGSDAHRVALQHYNNSLKK